MTKSAELDNYWGVHYTKLYIKKNSKSYEGLSSH